MRMMENFSGCRVLAYCVMCNHFHLLLEVTPKPKTPLSDEQLLKRLGALYPKAFVATVAKELAEARQVVAQGWRRTARLMCSAFTSASPTGCTICPSS
jgi:REP element-mobilizing transposase RayT